MCGIVGSINLKFNIDDSYKLLMHRGPDAQCAIVVDNVILNHLRLTILDAVGGKQPMSLDDRYNIIFNGEIYNHLDVRSELNLNCKSRSDTETILRAYKKIGPKCLNYLDGMFALAIYDSKLKELFLARDRAGKKPLYIYKKNDQLLFASEQNAIKGLVPVEINNVNVNDYLQGGLLKENTPYLDVEELASGTYAIINTKSLTVDTFEWWRINDFYTNSLDHSYDHAKSHIDNVLKNAIQKRIDSSDLEVGTFLSGGIDSGLVTAIASAIKPDLKAFTISFDGVFDESALARLVAQKYNVTHSVIPISFDNLKEDFVSIVTNYGEPFADSSSIPSYYVSREAKKHLTVILNGDGADELFGGYRRYVPYARYNMYQKGPLISAVSKLLLLALPHPINKKSKYNYIYRLLDILTKNKDQIYWSSTSDTFSGFFDKFHRLPTDNISNVFTLLKDEKSLSGLQLQMNLDFDILLGSTLLKKMDIATMTNSLEGRSPFLCKDLLEYAPRIKDSFKVKGTVTKRILRDLAKNYLPEELIDQPKRGFEIPLKSWIDNDLKDFVNLYLNKRDRFIDNFINPTFVTGLLRCQIDVSSEKRAKMLYKLLVTEIWASHM